MANFIISCQIISEDGITQKKKHLRKTGWCVNKVTCSVPGKGSVAAAFEASCREELGCNRLCQLSVWRVDGTPLLTVILLL